MNDTGNDATITQPVDTEALFKKFYESDEVNPFDKQNTEAPVTTAAPETETATKTETETEVVPTAEETTSTEVAPPSAPSQASPDPNEFLNSLPSEVRSRVEQIAKEAQLWQHRHQELASKNRRLHNEVNTLKQKVEAPKPAPQAASLETDDGWKKLEEVDPELAKILKAREEVLRKEMVQARQEAAAVAQQYVEPIQQEAQQRYIEEQLYVLTEAVPNWKVIKDDPMFRGWLESASPGLQSLWNSTDARDSIRLLKLYDDDMRAYFGQTNNQPPAAPAQVEAPKPSPATTVATQRQDKLARSAPLPAQPVGQAKVSPPTQSQLYATLYDNPEKIFEILQQQKTRS